MKQNLKQNDIFKQNIQLTWPIKNKADGQTEFISE